MKFAHALKDALEKDCYPATWVAAAVPYGQLKKCLKRVQRELKTIGLDEATIAHLLHKQDKDAEATRHGSAVELGYEVDGERRLVPKLTLCVRFEDGVVTDVALSQSTREYLQDLVARQCEASAESTNATSVFYVQSTDNNLEKQTDLSPNTTALIKSVDVPLTSTAEFFEILYDDVAELEKLQAQQQEELNGEIIALSSDIRTLSRPSKTKFHKSDLYRWRELFEIYLHANIFFSTRELDHGKRTASAAAKQLEWFQHEVNRRDLIPSFRHPASRQALQRFLNINLEILMNLKFQEINKQAISKILKKYDKRTMLGAGKTFPDLIKHDAIISGSVARDVCAQVNQDIIKIVPQFDDYACPVCCLITYRPVRMECGHVFCLECSCKLQTGHTKFCPICRRDVILHATSDNIDAELGKLIKKNFPREWRDAGIAMQTEDGIKRFGPSYKHPKAGKELKESNCAFM